ncbi:MAG: hypothetical protein IKP23_01705 [Elusimicrobiaceae bacterium]|nr:hypothetical protein [Elusimicrobiaceae bacterium]
MKKILLMFFVVFSICACSQKEAKPEIELEDGRSSPTEAVSNIASSIDKTINNNTDNPQPYYFSEDLKNALLNCIAFKEDIYAKNPDMRKEAGAMLRMFFGEVDTSSFKLIFDIKGKENDKCQVILNYDYSSPASQDFNCSFSEEDIQKLVAAMNDKSTEKKERTSKSDFVTITMPAREYDAVFAEIANNSCKVIEKELSKDDVKEMQHKMFAFSDKFKNSLKNCTPDTEVLKVMGMEMNKVKIKGKEKGKCHVVLQGFHILLNDNELSLSGFDELGELLSDETRATYSPSYKYQGTLFALSECEQISKSKDQNMRLGSGKEELSLSDKVKITRGIESSVKNNACQVLFTLKMTRNGKTEDHSLSCNLTAEQLAQYLQPYSSLLTQYGPKIEISEDSFSSMGGSQTEEVSKVDQELFLKMYKSGICKK